MSAISQSRRVKLAAFLRRDIHRLTNCSVLGFCKGYYTGSDCQTLVEGLCSNFLDKIRINSTIDVDNNPNLLQSALCWLLSYSPFVVSCSIAKAAYEYQVRATWYKLEEVQQQYHGPHW